MASFVAQVGAKVKVSHQGEENLAGTIRFQGETSFSEGMWVGVELDEAKGNTTGTVDNVKYFECNSKNGVFVRPNQVHPVQPKHKQDVANAPSTTIPSNAQNQSNIRKNHTARVNNTSSRNNVTHLEDDIPLSMEGIRLNSPKSQSDSNVELPLFDMQTRAFIFNKRNKTWIELGAGQTNFYWSNTEKMFNVRLTSANGTADILDHLVDPHIKLDDNIAKQQSWVFRATKRSTNTKDVLCLQYTSVHDARVFMSTFEGCRDSMLQLAFHKTNNTSQVAHANQHATNVVIDDSLNEVPSSTRVMRRRLTVSGSDPNLDGYQAGTADTHDSSTENASPRKVHRSQHAASPTHRGGGGTVVSYTGVSRKGLAPYNPDKQNQDSMIMQELPNSGNCKGELLLAVFDGHGENGHIVSRYFQTRIPQLLIANPDFADDKLTGKTMADALKQAESELINDRNVDTTLSGTTAVVSVLRGDVLYVANVGDSRIIKGVELETGNGSKTVVAKDISIDHKPDLPREQARIEATGGRVFAMKYDDGIDGPARVWLSYADMPGLAMSRSLCDTVGKEAGVTSEAELHKVKLSPNDRYIVLATDGLWEFMESNEVSDIINANMASGSESDPRLAISQLVKESNIRWRKEEPVIDDTTIVVAYFK